LKCKEEVTNPPTKVNLIGDNFGIAFELFLFPTNIKREVCDVLDFLFLFKEDMKKENLTRCYV
jgi:hypothetical protein